MPTAGAAGDKEPAAFGILGPVEIRGSAGPVTPRGLRQRVALAALLMRANKVVAADELIDQLWPQRVPPTAREQVPIVISGLRRLLREAGAPVDAHLLRTRRPGYLLQLAPAQLDAHRFEDLLRDADRELAADHPQAAMRLLESALSLWRGRALADVPSAPADVEAQRLTELRLSATERLIDVQFGLGRHRELVPQLSRLVAEHPLRERLRGQLMIALNEVGRRAEALEAYRIGRRLMVSELGLEPGVELQRIERSLLAGAGTTPAGEVVAAPPTTGPATRRSSGASAPGAPSVAFPAERPAQLPPDLRDFTGRGPELDAIRRLIDDAGRAVPIVVAVTGPPGVGKSALATHAGHLLRDRFPDGQLHVDLGGGERPGGVPAALAGVLAACGVPPTTAGDDLTEQVRLFRAVTAHRRMLVVLDDAVDARQVRQLIPGDPGCAVLVTSRCRLPGLSEAHHLTLDALAADEALTLLALIAGPDRVAAEPAAAGQIIDRCDRLPLAVRIAGARLAVRPHWSLATLAERLADPERRLDELRIEDLDVRAALESPLHRLPPRARLAARRLARLDAGGFATTVAAVTLDEPVKAVEQLLDQLVEQHILAAAGTGPPWYRLPALTRLLLREQAGRPGEVDQAPRRRSDRTRPA